MDISFCEENLKKYEYIYENMGSIIVAHIADNEFSRNFESVKKKLISTGRAIAVYGRRLLSSKQVCVTINGRKYCDETIDENNVPYTYYGGEKKSVEEMEELCRKSGVNTAYLSVLKREGAKNVVFFKDTGKYFKLGNLDTIVI